MPEKDGTVKHQGKVATPRVSAAAWTELTGYRAEYLSRGTVLRCPADYPYESVVDFLLIEDLESPSGFSLLVATGYKAGITLVRLPAEALLLRDGIRAVDRAWLVANWNAWIYERGPEGVLVAENYLAIDDPGDRDHG
ncbi:immunity protein 45 of polymorphic toxin system [Krasilnikovia cinnamomea]|uniref:Immunity protein 45 of polymorphic toxin system n=1 Tax=Krasilnikovia cinnamomea TaxID=349313 RepID=A0A4Q7ZNN5_9ACTN|nr:immunity protein 45 of polymorphic toxin system [Krasilnikovia cinnamomea]